MPVDISERGDLLVIPTPLPPEDSEKGGLRGHTDTRILWKPRGLCFTLSAFFKIHRNGFSRPFILKIYSWLP